jgi:hypothetical protein
MLLVNIVPSEHAEQVGFVRWIRKKYPGLLIFAIPNGGRRAISVAKKLKEEGVTRGIPDLMIPALKIFIEMKRTKGGVVSPEQKKIMDYLKRCGYTCYVCRGAREASIKILEFLEERNK